MPTAFLNLICSVAHIKQYAENRAKRGFLLIILTDALFKAIALCVAFIMRRRCAATYNYIIECAVTRLVVKLTTVNMAFDV